MRDRDRKLLRELVRIQHSEGRIPLGPEQVDLLVDRLVNDAPSFGGGVVTAWDLGSYMDEVHRAVTKMSDDVSSPKNHLLGSQSFRGEWISFVYGPDPEGYELTPQPRGWIHFYAKERGLVAQLYEVTSLWNATSAFETALIGFWSRAKEEGFNLSIEKPKSGYDEPPTAKTITDMVGGLVTVATIAAVAWGLSQVVKLRSGG